MPVGPPFNFKTTKGFAPAIRVALLMYELSQLDKLKWPKINAQVEKTFKEESIKAGAIHDLAGQPDPTRYGFMVIQSCGPRKRDFLVEDTNKSDDRRWRSYQGERPLCLHYCDVDSTIMATAEVVSANPETARLVVYGFFELSRREYKLKEWRPKPGKAYKEWQNAGSSWHFRSDDKNIVLNFKGEVTVHNVITEPKRRARGLKK